jgi:hypothetical protein
MPKKRSFSETSLDTELATSATTDGLPDELAIDKVSHSTVYLTYTPSTESTHHIFYIVTSIRRAIRW